MKSIVIAALALALLGFRTADSAAAKRGRLEAVQDVRAGQLILRTYGMAGHAAYSGDLQKKYGFKIEVVAGCIVDPALIAETGAYNEVMKAEIKRRFGARALKDLEPGRHKP